MLHSGVNGRPKIYSDDAVLCALLIKTIFSFTLKILARISSLLGLPLKIPSNTRGRRRAQVKCLVVNKMTKHTRRDMGGYGLEKLITRVLIPLF